MILRPPDSLAHGTHRGFLGLYSSVCRAMVDMFLPDGQGSPISSITVYQTVSLVITSSASLLFWRRSPPCGNLLTTALLHPFHYSELEVGGDQVELGDALFHVAASSSSHLSRWHEPSS